MRINKIHDMSCSECGQVRDIRLCCWLIYEEVGHFPVVKIESSPPVRFYPNQADSYDVKIMQFEYKQRGLFIDCP